MNYYVLSIILALIIIFRLMASFIIARIYMDINIKHKRIKDIFAYFIIFIFLPELLLGTSIRDIFYCLKISRLKNRVRMKNINNKYKFKSKL